MPDLFESYGIEDLIEEDDYYWKLQQYVAANGKPIKGYYGTPYFYLPVGDTEFWEGTKRNKENELEISEFHVHCCSQTIWKMVFTGIELTPKNWNKTERLFLMNLDSNEAGSIPVDIINADVIPGFLEGEKVDVQVVAPCLDVRYYATEEEYEANAPTDKRGKKWMIETGSLLPVSFLENHLSDSPKTDEEHVNDSLISFVAEVKKLHAGGFQLDENSKIVPTFIRCVAETQYGDLQFHHTFDQVPESMRDNIRVGAIITGTCILSADAALGDYENGIVRNAENNLRLIRYTLLKGEADRLRSVLTDQSVYETDNYEMAFHGPDEIVDRMKYVNENHKGKYEAYYAEVGEIDEPDTEYPVGTNCLVLINDKEEGIESAVFVDTDKDGNISRIKVSTDDRYAFRIHLPEPRKTKLDDIEIETPDSVAYLVLMRAIIIGFVNAGTELERIENDPDRIAHETYAKNMLDGLKKDIQEDAVQAFNNIIGYLFAKAVETELVREKGNSESDSSCEVVYHEYDAIRGNLHTTLDGELQNKLIIDMEDAQRFGKDVFGYMKRFNKTDDDFEDVFIQAAVAAQRIGKIYADKEYLGLEEDDTYDVEYEVAELYKQAYTTGIFDALYDRFTDDYSHISFWVIEPIQGKQNAINYYTGKGNALRQGKDKTSGKLVEITMSPDRVRPNGLSQNGVMMEENPVFLNRNDTGKIAVLVEQETEKELVHVLAIPTVNSDGTCSQLLIANPSFYSWKELD